jgi:hypothetical protein
MALGRAERSERFCSPLSSSRGGLVALDGLGAEPMLSHHVSKSRWSIRSSIPHSSGCTFFTTPCMAVQGWRRHGAVGGA